MEALEVMIIMNIFNKIKMWFYKKDAKIVMGKLTECESYKNYLDACKNMKREKDNKLKYIVNDINYYIEKKISIGQFYYQQEYSLGNVNKKDLKYLKKIYQKEGYKIKLKIENNKIYMYISWKHFKKFYFIYKTKLNESLYAYEETLTNVNRITSNKTNSSIKSIDRNIRYLIIDGKFKEYYYFNNKEIPLKKIKDIKNLYEEKGYVVKIKYINKHKRNKKNIKENYEMIISWNHWN